MPFGDMEDNGRAPKRQRTEPQKPNHIVLMTIRNALYPIDVEVIYKISSPLGRVARIVIFRKNGVQALVEFENVEQATRAKTELDGADIYQGCCTLKVEFAKPSKLNVYKNDKDTWDYTGCLDEKAKDQGRHKAALLGPPPVSNNGFNNHPGPSGPPSGPPSYNPSYDDFNRSRQPRNGSGYNEGGFDYHHGYGPKSGFEGRRELAPYGERERDFPPQSRGGGGGANFSSLPPPMQNAGCVLMVYGLAPRINAAHLFNLFCLYGNVIRVKFLRSKPGCAMVQMGDGASVDRAVHNVHNTVMFDQTVQVSFSKQPFLHEEAKAYDLPDGSPSYREYSKSRNNRFTNTELAAKNRIRPPSATLHFFNAPHDISEEKLRDIFVKEDLIPPIRVTMFENKNLKSQTGMLEFDTIQHATEGLLICNHAPIQSPTSPFPFLIKLCFTSGSYPKHLETGPPNGNDVKVDSIED